MEQRLLSMLIAPACGTALSTMVPVFGCIWRFDKRDHDYTCDCADNCTPQNVLPAERRDDCTNQTDQQDACAADQQPPLPTGSTSLLQPSEAQHAKHPDCCGYGGNFHCKNQHG